MCFALTFSITACNNDTSASKTAATTTTIIINSTTVDATDEITTSLNNVETIIEEETSRTADSETTSNRLPEENHCNEDKTQSNNEKITSSISETSTPSESQSTNQNTHTGTNSSYAKYINAYKNSSTNGLSGDEITFYNNLKQCLDSAKNCTRLVDKEKAVYDWIILHCKYDEINYNNNTIPWASYNPEGVFIYGTAVCDGYTKAMKLCMDILGIECERVVGTARGEAHSWNNIKLDDNCWYEVDVTWGDPVPNRDGRVDYQYFNVTSEYIQKNHGNYTSKNCTATKYSYWNTYASETYIKDYGAFYSFMISTINEGKTSEVIAFEYSNYDYFKNAYDYMRVYNQTGKNAIYDIDVIYEDNGKTYYPNGTVCAEIKITYDITGEMNDDEILVFIKNQSEFDSIIKSLSSDSPRYYCYCISSSEYVKGDFSATHLSDICSRPISYYHIKEVSVDTYMIYIGFLGGEGEKLISSFEEIDAWVDEFMTSGKTEERFIYRYGDNSARTDIIYRRIAERLQNNYGLLSHEYSIDFYSDIEKSHRVTLKVYKDGE